MTTHTWPTREEWARRLPYDDAWFKPRLGEIATPEEIEAARAAMWETWKAMRGDPMRPEVRLGWKMLGEGKLPVGLYCYGHHPALAEFHRRAEALYQARLAEWMAKERVRRQTDEAWRQELARRERIDGPHVRFHQ